MTRQTLSVIVPVYNGADFLADALQSILGQSRPANEVIVVDDGSTDGSAEVAQRFGARVTLLSQPNRGVGTARNLGIAAATGELLAFLDADDIMPPDRLQRQAELLESSPQWDMVFGKQCRFTQGEPLQQLDAFRGMPERCSPAVLCGAMTCRADCFSRAGMFDGRREVGEFVRWFDQAQTAGLCSHVPSEVAIYRRSHSANMSLNRGEYARMVYQILQQRRGAKSEKAA